MLVRRRGPRKIPGPRRPHPCGKGIMIFSLSDFFGYSMAVTSACDYLNLSSEDFHNWEVAALLMLLIFRLILIDFSLSAALVAGRLFVYSPAGKLSRVDIRALCLPCLVLQ